MQYKDYIYSNCWFDNGNKNIYSSVAGKQIILVQFHDFEQKLADLTFSIVNSNKNENFFQLKLLE